MAPEALKLVIYNIWGDELETLSNKLLCIESPLDHAACEQAGVGQSDSKRPQDLNLNPRCGLGKLFKPGEALVSSPVIIMIQ